MMLQNSSIAVEKCLFILVVLLFLLFVVLEGIFRPVEEYYIFGFWLWVMGFGLGYHFFPEKSSIRKALSTKNP